MIQGDLIIGKDPLRGSFPPELLRLALAQELLFPLQVLG